MVQESGVIASSSSSEGSKAGVDETENDEEGDSSLDEGLLPTCFGDPLSYQSNPGKVHTWQRRW